MSATTRSSHRAGEKRIGQPLLADAGARTVAADEADIVAERQQLVLDRPDQRCMIAAGKVGSSDRAVEQHVADMRKAHLLVEEHHAAGRMARTMQDVEAQFADRGLVAFSEPAVRREIAHASHAETGAARYH